MGRGRVMKSMVVVVIMVMVMKSTAAETFTVGDDDGWAVPSSLDFYSSWAAKQSFAVGDTLVFKFLPPHTVAKVTSKEAYDKCDPSLDKNANVSTMNPTEFTLTSEGEVFFFCTVKDHCPGGQKLSVNVTATGSGSGSNPGPAGSQDQDQDQSPPQSPPDKDSAPKPVALTLATLSLFLRALVLAFGYF